MSSAWLCGTADKLIWFWIEPTRLYTRLVGGVPFYGQLAN
jgi:hypothetical protein